jgi:hypothetical protein
VENTALFMALDILLDFPYTFSIFPAISRSASIGAYVPDVKYDALSKSKIRTQGAKQDK